MKKIKKVEENELTDNDFADMIRSILNCEPEEFCKRYEKFKKAEAAFNELYEPFKENLIKLHETTPELPNSTVVGGVKLIYVAPTVRTSIDTKKLKEEEPEIAKKFMRTSDVKASVRLGGI